MNSLLGSVKGLAQSPEIGMTDARPSTMQAIQQNPKVPPSQIAAPQQPAQQMASPIPAPSASMAAGAPLNMAMNPALLQQILSTMLLQPQQSLGSMMQPAAAQVPQQTTAASTLTGGPING